MLVSPQPGQRYRVLADRCRCSVAESDDVVTKTALLRMASAYDRRAAEAECKALTKLS